MIVLKDGDDMVLKSPQETKPNDTSHGSQMSSSEPAAAETTSHLSSHTCSTHTPLGQMIDVSTPDKQWRPLDVSGDHLASPPRLLPPLTTTLNHSLKCKLVINNCMLIIIYYTQGWAPKCVCTVWVWSIGSVIYSFNLHVNNLASVLYMCIFMYRRSDKL